MLKNEVTDLITDQEMAFARLVLSGTGDDREAAQAAGLDPDTAADTKSKPCVRAYMLGHQAAVQQQLAEQEAEGQRRLNPDREQILARLWEMANTSPEMTRGSIAVQFKALSMIVAMQGLIPDPRANSSSPQRASSPPPSHANKQEKVIDPEPSAALAQEEEQPGFAETQPAPAPNPNPASAPKVSFSKKKRRRRR